MLNIFISETINSNIFYLFHLLVNIFLIYFLSETVSIKQYILIILYIFIATHRVKEPVFDAGETPYLKR